MKGAKADNSAKMSDSWNGMNHVAASIIAPILNNRANILGLQYKQTGNIRYLKEAICVNQHAIDMTPDGSPDLPPELTNLGNKFGLLYEHTKRIEDLEQAIQTSRRAVSIANKDLPGFSKILNNLGNKLASRYEHMQNMEDLDEAIQVAQDAVLYETSAFEREDDTSLVEMLGNLGHKLEIRHSLNRRASDYEEYIKVMLRAIDMAPENYPKLVPLLNGLTSKLYRQFQRTGRLEDIELAIELGQRATQSACKDYQGLFERLGDLGIYLFSRWQRTEEIKNLEEGIRVTRQAIEIAPKDHVILAYLQNNLGQMLCSQYKSTGRIGDLHKATRIARRVMDTTPEDHPEIANRLHTLGQILECWYERTENTEILEEAIQLVRQAVKSTPRGHLDSVGKLVDLGNLLGRQYGRKKRIQDLTEAISALRRAVDIVPGDHRDLAGILANLGRLLYQEYRHTMNVENLKEAGEILEKAVTATPKDDPKLGLVLTNVGGLLLTKYMHTAEQEYLDLTINAMRKAVHVTPKDHQALGNSLKTLGLALFLKVASLKRNEDLEDAIKVTQQAWNCENAVPFVRIAAAIIAIKLLQFRGDFISAYDLSVEALDLLPYVHTGSLNQEDQQFVVSRFFGLAHEACSLALQTGRSPAQSLEILERGRGVILGLLMDDRSDVFKLKSAHPALYAQYETLRSEVNIPYGSRIKSISPETTLRTQTEATFMFGKCIEEIQQLPGFASFHKGLTAQQMQNCATEGNIVFVNMSKLRSDAIIVTTDVVKVLSLPNLSEDEAEDWIRQSLTKTSPRDRGRKNKAYHEFLSWLWYACAKPVLDELHCHAQSSVEGLPRIWWIGTGSASSFPFHSAGDMSAGLMESTYYRAISSYTPTLKALQYARQRASSTSLSQVEPLRAVIVAMPETAGQRSLPETRREIVEVELALGSSASIETLVHPDNKSTMAKLQDCNIAHFACHGTSNPMDPSKSGLILQKTKTATEESMQGILSVREIFQAQLSQARIAYLSACSTAQNESEILSDEVLHVVSGFQVAGFKHVVGCLWPSNDEVCVDVAKSFYAELNQSGDIGGGSDRAVAVALHRAVVKVRERRSKQPLLWAQYVHFGA